MEIQDLLNFSGLNALWKYKPGTVRRKRIPNKKKPAMQELYDYLETWVKRHG